MLVGKLLRSCGKATPSSWISSEPTGSWPDSARTGKQVPLQVGEYIELNDNRAVVVGICRVNQTFQANPVIYMTYSSRDFFAPSHDELLSFVRAKARPGQDLSGAYAGASSKSPGLKAYTRDQFKFLTFLYYLRYTGMPINFLTAVALGFLVGVADFGPDVLQFHPR